MTNEEAATYYGVQRFAEIWLGIRSRSFDNDAHGLLVPLACLMNHPAVGQASNVDARYDAARRAIVLTATQRVGQGEELTFSYGASLCAERALLVYGFMADGMPTCEGFYD